MTNNRHEAAISTAPEFSSFIRNYSSIASFLFAKKDATSTQQKTSTTKTRKNHYDGKSNSHHTTQRMFLLKACQSLFRSIESLALKLDQVDKRRKNIHDVLVDINNQSSSLSGLDELYVGESVSTEGDDNNEVDDGEEVGVDAETLWGQVDLQNEALHKKLKKSVKKLGIAAAGDEDCRTIQLLEMKSKVLNDYGDDGENSEDGEPISWGENGEKEDVYDVTRCVRERLERALQEQEDEDDLVDHSDHKSDDDEFEVAGFSGTNKKALLSSRHKKRDNQEQDDGDDELVDPAAEELNNGFFDINEMEAFADDEEDMLPEHVWKPTLKEKKKIYRKSFHQRQREGMQESDSDEEREDTAFEVANAKRKKYREDDEIEALDSLYSYKPIRNDDGLDEAVNMTAADLFGQPSEKYFCKWKARLQQTKHASSAEHNSSAAADDDDADFWVQYNDEQTDWGNESKARREKERSASLSRSSSDDEERESDIKGYKSDVANAPASWDSLQDEKLKAETIRFEKAMLNEKPWQMVGEASAAARPVNSLLDGTFEFRVASKVTPVITEKHTEDVEEIIKRRILNDDFDSITPRELPYVAWNKKRGELPEVSQEKAKLGLGELYEREYLRKAAGYDVEVAEKLSEEDKAKDEMKLLFANICSKLDALSNYHFAPRPMTEEAEVRTVTTPVIAMEEVLPLHVSDARGAAPEEVFSKKRGRDGILRSETELEQVRS